MKAAASARAVLAAATLLVLLAACAGAPSRPEETNRDIDAFGVELGSSSDYRELRGVVAVEEPCLKGYERFFDALDVSIGYGRTGRIRKITTRNLGQLGEARALPALPAGQPGEGRQFQIHHEFEGPKKGVPTVVERLIGTVLVGCLLAVGLPPGKAGAGAWTQGQGKLYDRMAVSYYFSDREFDGDGDRKDLAANGEFTESNGNNYLEYGLTDRITLINSLYYKYLRKDDDLRETKTWGVGDIDVAAKVKIAEGRAGVVAVQGLVKIPKTYDENDDLPLGNGQYDAEARLLYGRSLWPFPGYCGLELGYRWRFEDPSDEVRYLVELGGDFTKRLYGRVKLDGIYSMDNGKKTDSSGNPTTTNSFDLGKLDVALGYRIAGAWALEAEYTPALYGQNTAAGATYALALAYQTR